MEIDYQEIINASLDTNDSILNAMHAIQGVEGYLTEDAIRVLSERFDVSVAEVYGAASFYSMLRFSAPAATRVEVCRGAICHVAGSKEVIEALEDVLGIHMGERSGDGQYSLDYVECLGQCDASPSIVVNGELHTGMSPGKVEQLFTEKRAEQ